MVKPNANGFFPYTPATTLLYGLQVSIAMLLEEGLDEVFLRHRRLAAATRAAVRHWGLEVLCVEPSEYSPVLTAVLMPEGHDADRFRKITLEKCNLSLGTGLPKSPAKCSASAISATAMKPCCWAPWRVSSAVWARPACRTSRAA